MSTYQAIFSDMDGTLLNSQHQISPKTEQAIKAVIQQGIPFIPVSARPPYAITTYTNQLNTQQAIICYSGALILDKHLNALYSITLDENDLVQLTHILAQYGDVSISYYSGLDWFCDDINNPWILQESAITQLQAKPTPSQLNHVHKILLMGDAPQIQHIEQILKQHLPHLSIHRSKNEYLEIMNSAATKSKAIQFLQQHLNVTKENIIAFGDNFNDLDMLQYVGFSVAMGNAPDEIKSVAKCVTASNDQDGIALILNQVFANETA